ncbi:MAG: rhombosortase [Steroidobacteraceae bacterium]|jgi:rhomboid family GlyGly-CTERM serine protease
MNTRSARLLKSLNCDGRYGVALLLCLSLCALPSLGADAWLRALRYERVALLQGQYWRLFSAHLVHLDAHHLLLNAAGLLLLWMIFAREFSGREWLLVVLCSVGTIDAGLWWLSSHVYWYAGASGVLHGVWAAGACASLWRRERFGILLAAVLVGKLAYEHFLGPNPLDAGLPVVSIAHIYGAAGGALAALILALLPRRL